MIDQYGGVVGNLISSVFDHKIALRTCVGLLVTTASIMLRADLLVLRLLTSKVLWNLYPTWSKIVHLPLLLKYWGGKIVLQYMIMGWLSVEKTMLGYLTEVETSIVEPLLPVNEEDGDFDEN